MHADRCGSLTSAAARVLRRRFRTAILLVLLRLARDIHQGHAVGEGGDFGYRHVCHHLSFIVDNVNLWL